MHVLLFCFFFQAEDGIRDLTVTGVQTCALPILRRRGEDERRRADLVDGVLGVPLQESHEVAPRNRVQAEVRSEERRVGKEGRSAWSPYAQSKRANAPG